VGGLPDLVPHNKVGIVTEPEPNAIATGILQLYELGEDFFLPHLREEKKKYSWKILTEKLLQLASSPQ
jgi:glycosyltransferase involved in cell wall biosynthesis